MKALGKEYVLDEDKEAYLIKGREKQNVSYEDLYSIILRILETKEERRARVIKDLEMNFEEIKENNKKQVKKRVKLMWIIGSIPLLTFVILYIILPIAYSYSYKK